MFNLFILGLEATVVMAAIIVFLLVVGFLAFGLVLWGLDKIWFDRK
jgi:hypothetical protein